MIQLRRYRSILLAAVLAGATAGCGLEDAPLASVDISDLQEPAGTAVTQSAEGGAGQTAQAAQPNTTTAAPTAEPTPSAPPAAQTPVPVAGPSSSDVTVEITENGFGGVPKGFTLTLKKGVKARIKFVNSDPTGDNVHIITFSGLGLPQIQLSRAEPTGTAEFTPDTPGRYGFSCDNQWCTVHPKLRATLIVEE